MRSKAACAVLVLLVSPFALAYEWRSHNRIAFNAREILLIKVEADPELRAFLRDRDHQGYGDDLDTRAGTPYDFHGFFGIHEDLLLLAWLDLAPRRCMLPAQNRAPRRHEVSR
jgi:hypothetical protein